MLHPSIPRPNAASPRSRAIVGGLALLSAPLVACSSLTDACGPEFRETVVRGTVSDSAGVLLADAEMRLAEIRRDSLPRQLLVILASPGYGTGGVPLKGHVTRARLVVAGTRGGDSTLVELSTGPGPGDQVLNTPGPAFADARAFDAVRQHFLAGRVALVLDTDLVGRRRLRAALPLESAGRWQRSQCS